jgi:hypothetical protein
MSDFKVGQTVVVVSTNKDYCRKGDKGKITLIENDELQVWMLDSGRYLNLSPTDVAPFLLFRCISSQHILKIIPEIKSIPPDVDFQNMLNTMLETYGLKFISIQTYVMIFETVDFIKSLEFDKLCNT